MIFKAFHFAGESRAKKREVRQGGGGFPVLRGGELEAKTRLLTGSQAKTAFALRLTY